ncbi:MAG: hypothetical protein IJ871_03950 [Ruminococcus sp.]|nr:hypothetical protein [Ruminococcus sp.]MBR2304274.1 hypothetical protein [Ruminococcus sp.]
MKHISFKKKNCLKSLAVAAALVFSFAADSSAFDVTRVFAAAASTDADSSGETQDEDNMLKDVYGEITIYRWERINTNNYPTDSEWHPSLLFFAPNNQPPSYLSGVAPGSICVGPSSNTGGIDGVRKFSANDPAWQGVSDDSDVDAMKSYFISTNDRAYAYNEKDKQIDTSKNVFFTDSSRDCVYLKYYGRNENSSNNGIDGAYAPEYLIKMSKDEKDQNDYYICPDRDDGGIMKISYSPSRSWAFQSKSTSEVTGIGVVDVKDNLGGWCIFNDWSGAKDPMLARYFQTFKVETEENPANYCRAWYVGTQMRLSAIKGSTSVNRNQVLEISANEYISNAGQQERTEGVVLPAGETLTINKGGILSISGSFINNGTIVNNGGTILIKNGGVLSPFMPGTNTSLNGCGAIKCIGGDIIIQPGGALYGGLADENCKIVPFYLDSSSTLINMGTLVYGSLRLGDAARMELYESSRTLGSYFNIKNSDSKIDPYDATSMSDDLIKTVVDYYMDQGAYLDHIDETPEKKTLYFKIMEYIKPEDMFKYSTQYFASGGDLSKLTDLTLFERDGFSGMYLLDNIKNQPHIYYNWAGSAGTNFIDPKNRTQITPERFWI